MMSNLRRRGRTAVELWRHHGVRAVLEVAVGTFRPGSLTLQLFGLTTPAPSPLHDIPMPVQSCLATREEVERLVEEGRQEPSALAVFALGDRCLLQKIGGRLAGLVWMSTRPEVELMWGARLLLPADAVYSYRTWTDPRFRGRRLQARRHRAVLELARSHGRTRLLCFVGSTNFSSLNGVRHSGCSCIGTVRIQRRRDRVQVTLRITDSAWREVGASVP
jgi:GNAT superfamily N-acetyltransferase